MEQQIDMIIDIALAVVHHRRTVAECHDRRRRTVTGAISTVRRRHSDTMVAGTVGLSAMILAPIPSARAHRRAVADQRRDTTLTGQGMIATLHSSRLGVAAPQLIQQSSNRAKICLRGRMLSPSRMLS